VQIRWTFLALASIISWTPSSAWGLSLLSQSREVFARAEYIAFGAPPDPVEEDSQSASDLGPFTAVASAILNSFPLYAGAGARQDSSIVEPLGILLRTTATGLAGASAITSSRTDTRAWSDSSYALEFEIETPADYVLRAFLSASADPLSTRIGNGQVTLELRRNSSDVIQHVALESVPMEVVEQSLDVSGRLLPGTYLLTVVADARASAISFGGTVLDGADADFDLDFRVIPEPGTVLLLGLGLVGLSVMGRSH
jgi:hypothetical protein